MRDQCCQETSLCLDRGLVEPGSHVLGEEVWQAPEAAAAGRSAQKRIVAHAVSYPDLQIDSVDAFRWSRNPLRAERPGLEMEWLWYSCLHSSPGHPSSA